MKKEEAEIFKDRLRSWRGNERDKQIKLLSAKNIAKEMAMISAS